MTTRSELIQAISDLRAAAYDAGKSVWRTPFSNEDMRRDLDHEDAAWNRVVHLLCNLPLPSDMEMLTGEPTPLEDQLFGPGTTG